MSGPKGYEYSVRAAELERQRAVADARARCDALRERARADAAEARSYGDESVRVADAPHIASSASAADAQAAADAYARVVRDVAQRRDAARAASVARHFAAHLPQSLGGRIEIRWDAAPALPERADLTEPAVTAVSDAAETQRIATAVLEALVHVAADEPRESLRTRAIEFASAGDVRALKTLSLETHTLLREQRRRAALAAEADEIALTLAGIESPAAADARAALTRADDRSALKAAAALAQAARDEQRVIDERRFVIEQTAAALAELGYEIDEEFRTAAMAGDFAVLPKEGVTHHALQVRFAPDSARLLTNTVALSAGTSAAADAAAETETCADLAVVGRRLHASGVTLEQFHAMGVGAVPIERRLDAGSARRRGRAGARGQERERSR